MKKHAENLKTGSPETMAKIYEISAGTLANLRWMGKGPKYFKVGRKVLYRFEDFENWLFSNPVMTLDAHQDREL
jgi:hypothetical protein